MNFNQRHSLLVLFACLYPLFEQIFVVGVSASTEADCRRVSQLTSLSVYKYRYQSFSLRLLMHMLSYLSNSILQVRTTLTLPGQVAIRGICHYICYTGLSPTLERTKWSMENGKKLSCALIFSFLSFQYKSAGEHKLHSKFLPSGQSLETALVLYFIILIMLLRVETKSDICTSILQQLADA